MGRNHVRVLRTMDGVQVVGVVEPVGPIPDLGPEIDVVADVSDLVTRGVDMCVVASPTDTHLEVGRFLAANGVHTLIEKPLASDVADARELVAAFEAAGVVGAVGHIERFNPAVCAARARLEAGELGDVLQVATRRLGPFPHRIRDVGVILDLATHDLDLTMWVTGGDFVSISAQVSHRAGRQHEDLVAATGHLHSGVVTNHLVNWLTPVKERVTWITGERGCYLIDTLSADLTFHANGSVPVEWDAVSQFRGVSEGDTIRYAISKPEPLRVELEAFRDAVLGQDDAQIVSLEQGLAVVAAAAAMREAAATDSTVRVAPLSSGSSRGGHR